MVATAGSVVTVDVEAVTDIVDVNGAGDAFVGGFLAYHSQGASLTNAVKAGQWAAAHVIRRSGCSFDRTARFDGPK